MILGRVVLMIVLIEWFLLSVFLIFVYVVSNVVIRGYRGMNGCNV